jgi:TolA-binding protein
MDRQHRQELKHDKFIDELGMLSGRARQNQRALITIAAVAVALTIIGYGIYFYRGNREQKAQEILATAIQTMDSPLVPAAGQQPNPDAKFKTDAERSTAAEKQFKQVDNDYSGTDASDVAHLYLARIAASHNDVNGAKKMLQDFISDHPKSVLVGTARYSLYQLRIEGGEASQVANEVNAELQKTDDQVLPPDSLLALLAHAYDAQNAPEKSKDAYRRIATEFPESPYALEAQRRIGPA